MEPTCNKAPPLLRDLVIPSPKELDETEPVTEGISHKSELAPLVRSDNKQKFGARFLQSHIFVIRDAMRLSS